MSEAPKRRRFLSELSGLKWASGASIEAILNRLHERGKLQNVGGRSRRSLKRSVEADLNERTAYGRVLQMLSIPTSTGPFYDLTFVHPFALLNWLVDFSPRFASVFERALIRHPPTLIHPWRIILYSDEAQGGNMLAVDASRKLWAFYYSFLELGKILLDRELGWLVAAVSPSKLTRKVQGGLGALFNHMMQVWFGAINNFETGGCRIRINDITYILFAKLDGVLADEAALSKLFKARGAAGNKCCMGCLNVVSLRSDLSRFSDEILVDVSETNLANIVRHTDATIWATLDMLSAAGRRELDTDHGFDSNPAGILLNVPLRQHIKPSRIIFDWAHVLLSGGIALEEAWLFLSRVPGLEFHALHQYQQNWHWPADIKNPPLQVWNGGHEQAFRSADSLKMGASEFLGSYAILRYYLRQLLPRHVLFQAGIEAEYDCFMSLLFFLDGVASDPDAEDADALQLAIVMYGNRRRNLYTWRNDFMRPKHHEAIVHLIPQLVRYERMLSTFTHERKLKSVKKYSTHITDVKALCKSVTIDLLNSMLNEWEDETIGANAFISQVIDAMEVAELRALFPDATSIFWGGLAFTTVSGRVPVILLLFVGLEASSKLAASGATYRSYRRMLNSYLSSIGWSWWIDRDSLFDILVALQPSPACLLSWHVAFGAIRWKQSTSLYSNPKK